MEISPERPLRATTLIMYIEFHRVGSKSIGPNLQMASPYALPIHPREPLLPAIDRLKSYNKGEVENDCKTNSNATVTYNPTDGDYANVRDEWFASLADEL